MVEVKGVSKDVIFCLFSAINWNKPKTDDDWFAAADAKKALKPHTDESEGPNGAKVWRPNIKDGESVSILFENATFAYVEKTFKAARESGEVFAGGGADVVVQTMNVVKDHKKVEVEKKVEAERKSA